MPKTIAFLKTFAKACLPECDEETKKEVYQEVRIAVMYVKNGHDETTVVCNALNAIERKVADCI